MSVMETITLSPKQQQQIRILTTLIAGDIDIDTAAKALGYSTRHVERLRTMYKRHGAASLVHGNAGKEPINKRDRTVRNQILTLLRTKYENFNIAHARDILAERDGIAISYTALRRLCHEEHIESPRPQRRRSAHRSRRDRMPRAGMMLQADGSPHAWLEDRGPRLTLVSGIDDATSQLWGDFWEGETLEAYMHLLWSIAESHGLPHAIYTDRTAIVAGTSRRYQPLAGEETGGSLSQFARACKELDIRIILAHSPQAKGRTERSHGTLQDRLVSELRLEKIDTLEDARAYLKNTYLPRHNQRFSIQAADETPAWRTWSSTYAPRDVFCIKEDRKVSRDNTIRLYNKIFDIPKGPQGRSYASCTVQVHRRYDDTIGIFYQGSQIAEGKR